MTLHCCICGSDQVETRCTAWIDENDPNQPPELIDRCSLYPDRHWCRVCEDHPAELVDSDNRPLSVNEVQRKIENGQRAFFHPDHGIVDVVGYHLDDGATGFVDLGGDKYDIVDLSCLRSTKPRS